MKRVYCYLHVTGVPTGQVPFFCAGCPTCEDKRKSGKVTGLEPPAGKRLRRAS